jgi:hypothetical protein
MLQTYPSYRPKGARLGRWSSWMCMVAALAVVGFAVDQVEARGPGGGSFGGGGGLSRPSGGGLSGSRMKTRQRGTVQRPQSASPPTSANKATANGSANSTRQVTNVGNGYSGVATSGNTATANSGVVGSGNGNTGAVNNGNIGSGNVNTGNVVAGNDVDVDVNGGWTGYGYPAGTGAAYATGVAVGSTATATAVSSYYSTLPASCYPYAYGVYRYYSCAGTWYQQTYKSGWTVYVVVSDPTKN